MLDLLILQTCSDAYQRLINICYYSTGMADLVLYNIRRILLRCSHSDLVRSNPLKTSWSLKMKLRLEAKAIKTREKELKDTRSKELEVGELNLRRLKCCDLEKF